jgi:hypothetical protein
MLFGLRAGGCCLDRCSCVHVFSAINISGLLHRGKSAIKSATVVIAVRVLRSEMTAWVQECEKGRALRTRPRNLRMPILAADNTLHVYGFSSSKPRMTSRPASSPVPLNSVRLNQAIKVGAVPYGFFQSVMDFNSVMISFSLCWRLAWSLAATGYEPDNCKYSRFSFWISAISRLRAATRSLIPRSIKLDYIFAPNPKRNAPDSKSHGALGLNSPPPKSAQSQLIKVNVRL